MRGGIHLANNRDNWGEWDQGLNSHIHLRHNDNDRGLWMYHSSKHTLRRSHKEFNLHDYFENYPNYCTPNELTLFTLETGFDLEEMWSISPFKKPYKVKEK